MTQMPGPEDIAGWDRMRAEAWEALRAAERANPYSVEDGPEVIEARERFRQAESRWRIARGKTASRWHDPDYRF